LTIGLGGYVLCVKGGVSEKMAMAMASWRLVSRQPVDLVGCHCTMDVEVIHAVNSTESEAVTGQVKSHH
jgi:hypothetical protein